MLNWTGQWLVTFNPLKTEAVLFTLKKLEFLPHLIFENIAISFVNSATKTLGIMRELKYSISRNGLNQIHMSYMLSVVEYASVVWGGCSEQDSQTLQKIQIEAVRIVTGLTRSVSLDNLYKVCGWATLSQKSQQHKLSFMNNVNTGMVLSYTQDLIPPLVSEISVYPLRNNRNISVPLNRTCISQKAYIPPAFRLWNSLDDNFKNISTLPTFKKHIMSKFSIAHVPPYFSIGNRYVSALHARLKNKCSGLNSDLLRKVSNGAKIRNRYNQVPHLTQDTNGKVTNSQKTPQTRAKRPAPSQHIRNNPLCDLCNVVEDAYRYFFNAE